MSQYSKERNGNYLGDPSDQGRHPAKGRGSTAGNNTGNGAKSASFKNGQVLKGLPAHDDNSFPAAGRGQGGGKWQRDSVIKPGSI